MRRVTQSGLLLVIGVIAALSTVNGLFLNFVKPALHVPLLAASGVLILLGAYGVWEDRRQPDAEPDDTPRGSRAHHPLAGGGHQHTGPRVGWLLVVPFLLLGVAVPPPLGSYTAAADSGLVSDPSAEGLGPLPAGDPVPMSLAEFQTRALHDPSRSLEGRRVRLVGFASPGPGSEWVLTRMSLNCCAADGFAVKVRVEGADAVPDDQWVEVLGTWRPAPVAPPGAVELPVVEVQWMDRISVPFNPYE